MAVSWQADQRKGAGEAGLFRSRAKMGVRLMGLGVAPGRGRCSVGVGGRDVGVRVGGVWAVMGER